MYTCTSQIDSSKPVLVAGDPERHHSVKVDDKGVIFYLEQLISALVCVNVCVCLHECVCISSSLAMYLCACVHMCMFVLM